MAAGNTVTLDFAGDTSKLDKAFDSVGASANKMAAKVDEAAGGFDRAGEAADNVDTKAMGFHDTLTGLQDTGGAFAALAKGDIFNGLLLVGSGFSDLGSGLFQTVIPGIKSATAWLKEGKLATLGQAAASKLAAAGQWLLNLAMDANPIGLIVIGIVALIAVFVLLWNKSAAFRDFWKSAWAAIKTAAVDVWDWLKGLPGKVGGAFAKVGGLISAPFRAEFNLISDAWNNTVGRLHFSIPSWVPGLGGKGFDVPKLPHFHSGGIVPGAPGAEVLAVLQAGERVTPAGQAAGSGGMVYVAAGDSLTAAVLAAIRDHVATVYGGDVTIALAGVR